MMKVQTYAWPVGRVLMAFIFVAAGGQKLSDPSGTAAYMTTIGIPGLLVWPTILFEILAGLFIAAGFLTRYTALALAGFCVATALMAHSNFADAIQPVLFMKNLAMAGGFLILAVAGAGPLSVDGARAGKTASA